MIKYHKIRFFDFLVGIGIFILLGSWLGQLWLYGENVIYIKSYHYPVTVSLYKIVTIFFYQGPDVMFSKIILNLQGITTENIIIPCIEVLTIPKFRYYNAYNLELIKPNIEHFIRTTALLVLQKSDNAIWVIGWKQIILDTHIQFVRTITLYYIKKPTLELRTLLELYDNPYVEMLSYKLYYTSKWWFGSKALIRIFYKTPNSYYDKKDNYY